MSSPFKKQPEAVADKVLKRVEVSKVRRHQTPHSPPSIILLLICKPEH